MTNDPQADFILYDGDCPVCRSYVSWTRLKHVRPDIALIDARAAPGLVSRYRAQGIEINDSMIIDIDGQTLHGAAAMSLMSRLAQPANAAARVLMWIAAKERVAGPLYPILVRGRKFLLFLLGRSLI